jgi:hypothetical protein
VRIGNLLERNKYATYWNQSYAEAARIFKARPETLSVQDFAESRLMGEFQRRVSEILGAIADRVLPRTLEQLRKYGFEE